MTRVSTSDARPTPRRMGKEAMENWCGTSVDPEDPRSVLDYFQRADGEVEFFGANRFRELEKLLHHPDDLIAREAADLMRSVLEWLDDDAPATDYYVPLSDDIVWMIELETGMRDRW
ncbi:MAG: hypothetical protein FDZ75_01815 [Actinobacteria bacterium]|nr:MAG: hypothetical protein FDZ75_01815 [Actinomycetota bacterium]